MDRRIATFSLVSLLLTSSWGLAPVSGSANALPGRLLLSGNGIDLYNPGSGKVRRVAKRGTGAAFYPSGKAFAYVRAGGCYPSGPHSCYTEYSVFEKSLKKRNPAAPGRRVFGWTQFFVRSVDVAPGGRLIFSAKPGPGPGRRGRGVEIYSSALDGSEVRRLTHNHVFDNDPAVSPDGTHIAFARKVDGRGQIFSMRIDGSHLKRLTHDGRRNRLPSWSPGGRRLVFISQPAAAGRFGYREVYSVAAGGGRKRRLTHNRTPETRPIYSPNGRSIAFLFKNLWLMSASGAGERQIFSSPHIPGYEGGLDWR